MKISDLSLPFPVNLMGVKDSCSYGVRKEKARQYIILAIIMIAFS